MNAPIPEPSPMHAWGDSDSRDSMIVEAVGTPDLTPQPATGKLLDLLRAERAKLDCYRRERADRERGDQPPAKPAG